MQHALQLSTPLALDDIERITRVLCALPGVRGIETAPGSSEVQVSYDEDTISVAAISGMAARAGYAERGRGHAHGGCCGGCGGH